MIRNRRGSAVVEAAVALPLVILAVITMIYVLLNMFCAVRSDVRLHVAVGESAGISSGTWYSYRNHPRDISTAGSRYMLRKCIYGTETLHFRRAGMMDHSIDRQMETRGYITDEKKYIRYSDFFDRGP
ncbi:MAG: hypothetical protein LKJ83_01225 [Eubacteriaceae bacterium]|jgi:hypothetical protein|nr:hypothetical protein [Eubacteriaceae bacterium]